MKKLLAAMLAVSLLSLPAIASYVGGGKKKAKKKARTECKKDNSCDPKNCDPKNCDKNCDPRNCQYPVCSKEEKCSASTESPGKN